MLSNAGSVHTRRWARAYAARGHRVDVLSIRRASIPGVRVHPVTVGPVNTASRVWTALSYLRLGLGLRRRLDALRPEVIQACYAPTHGALAAHAGRRPWLLSVWGSDVVGVADRRWPVRRWTSRAVARADRVCATSHFLAAEVERLHPRQVAVTPFGVDTGLFRPPERAHGDQDRFVIGFVKTLSPAYGPDVLLRAVARLARQVPTVRLVLAGRDATGGALERLARRLGLADRVTFPGLVPHEAVPELLAGCDVFANPSVCAESFGVSILEASACGLPVVASEVGGIPEVCRHGETGLLVSPGDPDALADALLDLARDRSQRRDLGRAGRRFVEDTYPWDACVSRMLHELETLRAAHSGD